MNFKKISRKKKIVIGIILTAAIIGAWRLFSKKTPTPQYQTTKVEKGMIISSTSASGQMVAANYIEINTKAKGIVKKVYVQEDAKVSSGQKIAEIELDRDGQQANTQAYSSHLSAKNSLESAKTTLYTLQSSMFAANQKFINDAAARGLVTGDPTYIQQNADWLAAEAKYKNQQAVIVQAQISLTNTWQTYLVTSPTITSPVSGTIKSITLAEGMNINSGATTSTRIAIIQSEGTPIATFNLSEIDIPKVKIGKKATIKLDSISDKTFTGKVVSVDKIGTVSSGVTSYPVTIKFDTKVEEILPNMSAIANIILDSKDDVLLVPSGAIQQQGNQNVVRVIQEGKPQIVIVETGLTSDTQTEIISGLSEGDEIVISTISNGSQPEGKSVFSSGFGGAAGRMIIGR